MLYATRQFAEGGRGDNKCGTKGIFAVADSDAAGELGDFNAVAAAAG